jgi:hypothetical protein
MNSRLGATLALLSLAALTAPQAMAQIVQKWTVAESDVVVSWAWPDLNGDGIQELVMEDGVSSWFFDGADTYTQVWLVEDSSSSTNTLFQLWQQKAGFLVFRQQNAVDQQSRLDVYAVGAASPAWSTAVLPGNITEGGIGDLDGDGQQELAYSWHSWDGSAYTSHWTVRNLATGAVELVEQTGAGFLAGPFVGNVEGSEADELLLNWYWTSGTSELVCWGINAVAVTPPQRPESMGLSARPNPFNPLCIIRLDGLTPAPDLGIFNVLGEEVRRLPLAGSGTREVVWDGLDQRGRPAPSGAYVARAGSQSLRITLAR